MMLDPATAAAERADAARQLIAQAQTDVVELETVSALDLCVLGGPGQALFDERVTRAWTQLTDRRRRQVTEDVTASMVRRGLLIDDNPQTNRRERDSSSYSLKPHLGLVLAARCRPAFIVTASGEGQGLRPLSLFALGDLAEPVRGFVAEVPAGLPPDRDHAYLQAAKLGPLGWLYRYVLVPPDKAAEMLARWTIKPPPQSGKAAPARYVVSAYCPDRENPVGHHLGVRGNGSRATLDQPGVEGSELNRAEYDLEGLCAIMLNLLNAVAR